MSTDKLPEWVTAALVKKRNKMAKLDCLPSDWFMGAEFGARLVLDRLRKSAEKDYQSTGAEAKALNIARERVRKEVLE